MSKFAKKLQKKSLTWNKHSRIFAPKKILFFYIIFLLYFFLLRINFSMLNFFLKKIFFIILQNFVASNKYAYLPDEEDVGSGKEDSD